MLHNISIFWNYDVSPAAKIKFCKALIFYSNLNWWFAKSRHFSTKYHDSKFFIVMATIPRICKKQRLSYKSMVISLTLSVILQSSLMQWKVVEGLWHILYIVNELSLIHLTIIKSSWKSNPVKNHNHVELWKWWHFVSSAAGRCQVQTWIRLKSNSLQKKNKYKKCFALLTCFWVMLKEKTNKIFCFKF